MYQILCGELTKRLVKVYAVSHFIQEYKNTNILKHVDLNIRHV